MENNTHSLWKLGVPALALATGLALTILPGCSSNTTASLQNGDNTSSVAADQNAMVQASSVSSKDDTTGADENTEYSSSSVAGAMDKNASAAPAAGAAASVSADVGNK